MGLRIHSNITSLRVQRDLERVGARVDESLERLSSGLRVNQAEDDAAALGVSERLRVRLKSIQQARRNVEDVLGMQRFALGGLESLSDILASLRELALQSLSGTVNAMDREVLNNDFQSLKESIDRVARRDFNGLQVLADPFELTVQIGPNSTETLTVHGLDMRTVALGLATDGVATTAMAETALEHVDLAANAVSLAAGSQGAVVGRLESTLASLSQANQNLTSAESLIRDADYAREITRLTHDTVLQDSAVALLAQANSQSEVALILLEEGAERNREEEELAEESRDREDEPSGLSALSGA